MHNAIRLLLPLFPVIGASSPIMDNHLTGYVDSRLKYYGENQKNIPSIAGEIIPEFVTSEDAYHQDILLPMYRDIQSQDPEGVLQQEWLNSRGVIPKFSKKALEIRLLDTQEYITADIAIAKCVFKILENWVFTKDAYLNHPIPTTTFIAHHTNPK